MSYYSDAAAMLDFSVSVWILIVVGAIPVAAVLRSGRRERGLPPGPPTIPVLGNIHLLKRSFIRICDWDVFQGLIPKYGTLLSFKCGNHTAIILQDGESFRDLLEKRGAIYSSRPMNFVTDTSTTYDHPIFERDPYKWKINRKMIVSHFHRRLSSNIVKVQEAESMQLLIELSETPDNYEKHLLRFTISVLSTLAYGYRTPTPEHFAMDGFLSLWYTRSKLLGRRTPPVDFWPWLQYLPRWLSPWRQRCEEMRPMVDNTFRLLMDTSRKLYDHDLLDSTSFAHKLFEQQEANRINDHWLMMLLAVVLEGRTDILANSICTTILALLTHPEVLAKAITEIDQIFNEDTVPTMEHYASMPYIRCIAKESLRWRPPFPLGVLHALEQDDEYRGYKIPKGATIATNIWAIHHDPDRYANPEKFQPERYEQHLSMTGDYMANPDHLARDHFAFGAGRRTCPGVYIAEQAHILVTARLIWAFHITPSSSYTYSTDSQTAFEGHALRKPKSFPLILKPRSEKRLLVIQREMARLQEVGGPLAKRDGMQGEADNLKSSPEGYAWRPRSTDNGRTYSDVRT